MEEVRLRYCDVLRLQESASVSPKRISGGPIYIQIPRCTSTGPTSSQSCSMDVKHGLSPRPCLNAWMPSTPGACIRSYEFHTPGTLQIRQSGASQTVCQYLKGSSISGWSSSGIWLGQPRRKIITKSSPPLCVRHLTGGDPLDVQEPPGSERSMRTSSPRTLGSIRHEGRLGTGRFGIKSSVRQRADRSSPPRRRRWYSVHTFLLGKPF